MHEALRWLRENRRRLAPLALVAAVLVVGAEASRAVPRETSVRVRVADPGSVREVSLDYVAASGDASGARLAFPHGAPPRIDDVRELSPGRYEVHVDVRRADGTRLASERRLEVPAQGTLLVDLTGEDPR